MRTQHHDRPATSGPGSALADLMANGVMPYASYSTSFDPTIGIDDTTGETLDPTEGKQWEVGVEHQPASLRRAVQRRRL